MIQELHRWIKTQRTMFRTDKLRPERKERLEAAGIAFGDPAYKQGSKRKSESITNEKKFELMLTALAQYKAENGDCGVPRTWKENPKRESLACSCLCTRVRTFACVGLRHFFCSWPCYGSDGPIKWMQEKSPRDRRPTFLLLMDALDTLEPNPQSGCGSRGNEQRRRRGT